MHYHSVSRRRFLKTIGAGIAAVSAGCLSASKRNGGMGAKPNILLIMADDVGSEVLGCYGGTSYDTRNLDALAAGGRRYTHCYSTPVCSPTRVKIMTGRYGFRTTQKWGHIPPDEITFGHVLQKAGYATAIAGKWQMCLLKNDPGHVRKMGFEESCVFGWHEGPRYHDPLVYENGTMRELKGRYGPDEYCDFLIRFMEKNSRKKKPFLAYYSMALCHAISDDFKPPPPPGPDGSYQSYKELVAYMDKNVGRLIKALKKLGLRENTLVLFTGDNGTPRSFYTDVLPDGTYVNTPFVSKMGDKTVRGGKGSLKDSGTRVPFIANCPGTVPAGTVRDGLIDFSDFMPTLAEIAGGTVPADRPIDGRSFASGLWGGKGSPRTWAYNQHGQNFWIRTRRWKLYGNGTFFDMKNDPEEKSPLEKERLSEDAAKALQMLQKQLVKLKGETA